MTETVGGTYRADLGDLGTLGPVEFNDGVNGQLTTAHPALMEDGTLINLINGVRCCLHNFSKACHACGYEHSAAAAGSLHVLD
jgi:carotenoid cleavage dioxygenase-like enzyme